MAPPSSNTEEFPIDTAEGRALRLRLIGELYGPNAAQTTARVEGLLERRNTGRSPSRSRARRPNPTQTRLWDEGDVWVITYADQFQREGEAPLETLREVAEATLDQIATGVHVLPFYPWSSDDGFSVMDYHSVAPEYGTWEHIEALAIDRRLMVDAVINHTSVNSVWFQNFIADQHPWRGYFRTEEPTADVSAAVRPRTHPLLTEFDTASGPRWVWTTFSADQADLDYANPDVLLEVIDVLAGYVEHGAEIIRLDAIGFLWKDATRASIHLPETHLVIQLLRSCLDELAPGTILISETNVPHAENVSYFHRNPPEVHAVYQFPLAPLLAHAALTGDVSVLSDWAATIDDFIEPGQTFLNFLASHDGIGLRPIEGLLSDSARSGLAEACLAGGGEVSYRDLGGGQRAPYELNTTWFDLMSFEVNEDGARARHLATHAFLLALPGVAALYVHSLFGSSNDRRGFEASGHPRSLNRQRFDADRLLGELQPGADSRAAAIYGGIAELVAQRRGSVAFHPEGRCSISNPLPGLICVERSHEGQRARCTVNLTSRPSADPSDRGDWCHLGSGEAFDGALQPYGWAWLEPREP